MVGQMVKQGFLPFAKPIDPEREWHNGHIFKYGRPIG